MTKTDTKAAVLPAASIVERCLLTGALLGVLMLALPADAQMKCWTNNEGVYECGNIVPPEFAQQGHEEKSAGGITLDKQARAKTLEEIESERARIREQELAAKAAREQAAKDKVLLYTFSSEDDMILARDGQVEHLESQVKITESHIEKLRKSLDDLIANAANHERRGKEPPEKLLQDIDSLREQIAENEAFIQAKFDERTAILDKFEVDIARFRKLKNSHMP